MLVWASGLLLTRVHLHEKKRCACALNVFSVTIVASGCSAHPAGSSHAKSRCSLTFR